VRKPKEIFEVLGVGGEILLKRMLKKQDGREGVDWILLAYDRYQWRALVSRVMNLWIQ
jgi:hypothetical protein